MLYVMNTTIMPNPEGTYKSNLISVQRAKELVKSGDFTSAVGHQATAELMADVLDANISFNRITVSLESGDKMLCLKLKPRLGEGVIIKNKNDLESIGYDFVLIAYSE